MLTTSAWRVARIHTSKVPIRYLLQLPIWWAGRNRARWAVEAMHVRVVANDEGIDYCRRDVDLYARIVRRHHYLGRWPVKKGCKILAYLADLEGVMPGPAGAAGMAMFALQPANCVVAQALDVHPCERLELVRCWRADDLDAGAAPYFTPHMLNRILRGWPAHGLEPLVEVWRQRKCTNGLVAVPRLLVTYADPEVGHDGGLYRAAGFVSCGRGSEGKLIYAYALDRHLRKPLLKASERFISMDRNTACG